MGRYTFLLPFTKIVMEVLNINEFSSYFYDDNREITVHKEDDEIKFNDDMNDEEKEHIMLKLITSYMDHVEIDSLVSPIRIGLDTNNSEIKLLKIIREERGVGFKKYDRSLDVTYLGSK